MNTNDEFHLTNVYGPHCPFLPPNAVVLLQIRPLQQEFLPGTHLPPITKQLNLQYPEQTNDRGPFCVRRFPPHSEEGHCLGFVTIPVKFLTLVAIVGLTELGIVLLLKDLNSCCKTWQTL